MKKVTCEKHKEEGDINCNDCKKALKEFCDENNVCLVME